jgi:hypothetical protein
MQFVMRMCHVFKAHSGVTTSVILLDLEMMESGTQSVSRSLNTMDPLELAQNFMKILEKAGRLQVV